jgi:hypothetical protein
MHVRAKRATQDFRRLGGFGTFVTHLCDFLDCVALAFLPCVFISLNPFARLTASVFIEQGYHIQFLEISPCNV